MKLAPTDPPGRITRKARAFASEILQFRAQGYTFEAIREALAGAGVHVSNSTVQREVARAAGRPPTVPPVDAAASHRGTLPQESTGGGATRTVPCGIDGPGSAIVFPPTVACQLAADR